jgi:uncharacterized membrane protein (UPF0136 family)
MDKRVATIVAYVITAVWAVGSVLEMISPRYKIPVGIQAVMAMVATYLFTDKFIRRNDDGDDKQ